MGARICNLVKNPSNLQAAEVSRQRKSSLGAVAILAAARSQRRHHGSHARILPHNRVVNRFTALAVPDDRGLALVRNSNRRQIRGLQRGSLHGVVNHILRATPNLLRIVLDPAWLRIDLLVLFLRHGHHSTGAIKNDEARTCSSLINGPDIARHCELCLHTSARRFPGLASAGSLNSSLISL